MGLLFVGEIFRQFARRYAGPIARGLANVERPAFDYAYRGARMSRLKKPIYRGYKAGTVIGTAGAGLRDAFLSSSPSDSASDKPETRNNVVKPRSGRLKYSKYRFNRRCREPRYR